MSEKQQAYISRVHLKGYKSIRDLEIDLKSGLNIIIGPNGSGKTNFLELIQHMNEKWIYDEDQFDLAIQIKKGKDIVDETYRAAYDETEDKFKHLLSYSLNSIIIREEEFIFKSQLSRKYDTNIIIDANSSSFFKKYNFRTFIIGFRNEFSGFLYAGFDLKIRKIAQGVNISLPNIISSFPSGLENVVFEIFDIHSLETDQLRISENLIKNISKFTPINDLKIDLAKINKYVDESKRTVLSNINLLFLVNKKWLNWEQLSDGTKRLFFISCCLNAPFNIFLLEEPELGIHPDQLYKLMDFIKEQSKEKQIILTTHSPEVLNILEKDELDRIIVTRYDSEKGTQMHHLSEKQIKKGHIYMEETGDLSDFWVHSNLEEYEAETTEN